MKLTGDPKMTTADADDRKLTIAETHREHLRRDGGGRRRPFWRVHDGVESVFTLAGIRRHSGVTGK